MTRQGGGWSFVRKLLWMVGVLAVPAAVGALCVGFMMHVRSQPTYGDAQNSEDEFTLAPNVRVQILPAHRNLNGKELLDFAVNDQGAIVVNTSTGLFDLTGGRRIGPGTDGDEQVVNSMAFAKPGLIVVSVEGIVGTWDDEGFMPVDLPGHSPVAVYPGQTRDQIFVVSESYSSGDAPWVLSSLAEGQKMRALTGSPVAITAVAADNISPIFAAGGALFRLLAPGQPAMLFRMPDDSEIIGLATMDGAIYFATYDKVYALGRDMAVPVVLGLGGQLRSTPEGLLVLDKKRGWLFRIVVGEGK
jgi:hypothetical protein